MIFFFFLGGGAQSPKPLDVFSSTEMNGGMTLIMS